MTAFPVPVDPAATFDEELTYRIGRAIGAEGTFGACVAAEPTDAVEGVPALVEAVREHRVDTLLIRPDGAGPARETRVGADPDQVAVRRTEARTPGENQPM